MSDSRPHSPFPGMDPYLESRWSDVHAKLIGFIGESIQPLLPRDLRARAEERLLLEAEADEDAASGAYRYASPTVDRWVQIVDVSTGNRVITAIEILSPWNKAAGRLNRQYLRKLEDYARAGVSVIEIDLLRYPPRGRMAVTEADIPPERRTPYVACVRLGWDPETWRAYPIPLQIQFPVFPIPLRATEPQIDLDLQPIMERVYVAGGHDDINYNKPPEPPLSGADAAWAAELLAKPRQ